MLVATVPKEARIMRQTARQWLARWTDKSSAIDVATRSLSDGDPLFAVSAAQQLGAIGGAAGKATLQSALSREQRVTVKAAITQALLAKP